MSFFTDSVRGRPNERARQPRSGRLRFLEHARLEPVPLQQLVELGSIPARQGGCLGDVAAGDLEEAYEVIALELLARLFERNEDIGVFAQRTLHERRGD